jgi:IS5 family transposase
VAVRLTLAGLLIGIVHDRKLMREAQVNIAIRWFIGYGLHEELPHHSSLTRIRQRWGEERFHRIFKRTVEACLQAKIATAEVVHIDASLIRANVSWESLVERHVEDVLSENRTEEEIEVERKGRQSGRYKKVCTTDPDATMATNARNRRLEPAYKQHTAVDDKVGVILDVAVTTGQTNEGEMIEPQVDEVEATTGIDIKTVTADAATPTPRSTRARAAWHRCADSNKGRADPERCASASVPVRCQERHREVSARQSPAVWQPSRPWALLLRPQARLPPLFSCLHLSLQRSHVKGGRNRPRLSGVAPRTTAA